MKFQEEEKRKKKIYRTFISNNFEIMQMCRQISVFSFNVLYWSSVCLLMSTGWSISFQQYIAQSLNFFSPHLLSNQLNSQHIILFLSSWVIYANSECFYPNNFIYLAWFIFALCTAQLLFINWSLRERCITRINLMIMHNSLTYFV